jgi:HEAT repeat protein
MKENETSLDEKKELEKAIAKRLKDNYRYVKEVAIYILGELKDQKYFNDFVSLLKDSDSMIRGACVNALGLLNHPDTLSILKKFEENEYDGSVISALQHAMKKLKS